MSNKTKQKKNQSKNLPEILSVGWFLCSSTASIETRNAAERNPKKLNFERPIFDGKRKLLIDTSAKEVK